MASVEGTGYGVIKTSLQIPITNLNDDNDARALQISLANIQGVINCVVNFVAGSAAVEYIPTVISRSDIQNAIIVAGFKCVIEGGATYDAANVARVEELANQKRLLVIGSILAVPIVVLSMISKVGVIADNVYMALWIPWLLGLLTAPVQFYVG